MVIPPFMSPPTLLDRYKGCLVGLACGDALGAPFEFQYRGSFIPPIAMIAGGTHRLAAGQWTDDTSLALCLSKSLIDKNGFDPIDQLRKYYKWFVMGYLSSTGTCFDIGITTRSALEIFRDSHFTQEYCGPSDPLTASNGSLMRLGAVPLFYMRNPLEAIEKSGESSRTTHQAPASVDACRYMGALIVGALNGVSKDVLLSSRYSPIPGYWEEHPLHPDIDDVASGSFKMKDPHLIEGSGHASKSLEAALWAFHRSTSFGEGCTLAVGLGDDADTTGAVYGQLAGAFYGIQGIPQEWRDMLFWREQIITFAQQLFELAHPSK